MVAQSGKEFPIHSVLFVQRMPLLRVVLEIVQLQRFKGTVLDELIIAVASRVIGSSTIIASFTTLSNSLA
ncbi:hypothetical protein ES703_64941 [subsurface metagenome]